MNTETRKSRLFIGTVDDLFSSDSEEESEAEKSKRDIENFANGSNDIDFNETLMKLDETTLNFHTEDDEFIATISKRTKECTKLPAVRNACKLQAEKFHFDAVLFNRIPMWEFRCVAADDPLCKESRTDKLEIMSVFMLINKISADLMMAFYIEGGQSIDDAMKLHKFFNTMHNMYNESEEIDLIGLFGDWFTLHCETKTLRRIDLTAVKQEEKNETKLNEPFLTDSLRWRRERINRQMIRSGKFTINDRNDLLEVKEAWRNGLQLRGRYIQRKNE